MHQLSDPEFRRISTFATAPFFNSTTASQPLSLITRPRNSRKFGLCPTTSIESCRAYFSSIFWKSENPACGRRAFSITSLPSCPISLPTSAAVCVERFRGLETIISTCTPSAASARPMYPHCSMPSLSKPRFSSFFALLNCCPALAWRKKYRNIWRDYSFPIKALEARLGATDGISSIVFVPSAKPMRKSCELNAAGPRGGFLLRPRNDCQGRR